MNIHECINFPSLPRNLFANESSRINDTINFNECIRECMHTKGHKLCKNLFWNFNLQVTININALRHIDAADNEKKILGKSILHYSRCVQPLHHILSTSRFFFSLFLFYFALHSPFSSLLTFIHTFPVLSFSFCLSVVALR